jgi:hypothetical protein
VGRRELVVFSALSPRAVREQCYKLTMERMTTHGRFSLLTMACERVDFPDPELPAMPIMLTSAHGGA